MLPLLFELLNQLHKRPVRLGKGNKKATRTQEANCLPKPQEKCQKGFLREKAWPDVACQEKSSKKRQGPKLS
jgi:hypothetical protein